MADQKIAKPAKIPKPVFQTNLPTNELFDEIIEVYKKTYDEPTDKDENVISQSLMFKFPETLYQRLVDYLIEQKTGFNDKLREHRTFINVIDIRSKIPELSRANMPIDASSKISGIFDFIEKPVMAHLCLRNTFPYGAFVSHLECSDDSFNGTIESHFRNEDYLFETIDFRVNNFALYANDNNIRFEAPRGAGEIFLLEIFVENGQETCNQPK
jgi:hypothetical protein